MAKFKNTLQKGAVRYIVFKEGDIWYGTALEFNIVESGDDPREVLLLLMEAIQGYVESCAKAKARPYMLNQKPQKEYEDLWGKINSNKKLVKSPLEIYSFGQKLLGKR